MRIFLTLFFSAFLSVCAAFAQQLPSEEYAYKIKQEAFSNSQMEAHAAFMTDFMGPRLTSSKQWERAETLTVEMLKEMGFSNVRAEYATDFSRGGWDNQKTYAAMTVPYYTNFMATPRAWTGSTNGLVKSEVVLLNIQTEADFEKYRGKIGGKIILTPSTQQYQMSFEPLATRYTDEQLETIAQDPRPTTPRPRVVTTGNDLRVKIQDFIKAERPAVVLSSSGTFNVSRLSGANYTSGEPEPIAELYLAIEAYARMQRLLEKNIPVEMEVEIKNEFNKNLVVNNIIAEIPGTDPKLKDEIVLIGAHYDSWHAGTGAADNASGCMVMLEALRILKEVGAQPRRTIRLALWGGEEQGLHGSRGYMQNNLYDSQAGKPKSGFDKFTLYLNMDNGSGKFRGIYLEENDMAVPYFKTWMQPLESLGFTTISLRKTASTDHVTFDRIGLPAYQFIQDPLEYGRGYHTSMDTYERLSFTDLKYNAAVAAWIAYCAAMDNGRIPVKPIATPAGR